MAEVNRQLPWTAASKAVTLRAVCRKEYPRVLNMLTRYSALAAWLLALGALYALPSAEAQDFRVDTEVFFGAEKNPVETLTIFTEGRVYDFLLAEPREITVYDPKNGKFTLLNESQRIQSFVTTQDLMAYTLDLETQAVQEKNSLIAFAARPQFETKSEEVTENGQTLTRVTLAAKPLEYVVLGQQPDRGQAVQIYRNFADWYARLNSTRPLNLPAGARLALNQALAERNLLPREITRTISPPGPLAKKLEVKSRHLVNWTLSGKDRKEIERAGEYMATFRLVSYDEYRASPAKVAANKQVKR
jgi:hypothetical protein